MVEFEGVNGSRVMVDPKFVTAVWETTDEPTERRIMLVWDQLHVKNSVDDIVKKLQEA